MRNPFLLLIFLFTLSCGSIRPKEKLNKAPELVASQFLRAQNEFKTRQYAQAIESLKGILRFHRNTEIGDDALFLLAKSYSRLGNWQKSVSAYRAIYDQHYDSSHELEARMAASRVLTYKLGRHRASLKLIDETLLMEINRESQAELLQIRFRNLMNQGAQLEAFETLVKLSEIHPLITQRESFKRKAKAFLESRLSGPALKDFADDSPQSGFKVDAMYRYGVQLMGEGQYRQAKSYFQKLIAMSPKSYTSLQARKLLAQLSASTKVHKRTIGVVLPLSGRYSNVGYQALWGLQLALGINGGRNSENVQLAIIDSRGKPEQARKAVRRLAEENHAIAMVGGLLSRTAYAASIQAQEVGIPFIALSQKEGLTDIGPFIFRNALTVEAQLEALINTAMNKKGMKRFAILYPNDPYGVKFSNLFWKKIQGKGGQVVGAQAYSPGETDFKEPIQKLVGTFYIDDRKEEYSKRLREWYKKYPAKTRRRKKPPESLLSPIVDFDAIFIPDGPKAIGQIAPMLAYNDVKNVYLMGTNLWNTQEFLRRGQNFVSQSLFTDGFYQKNQNFLNSPFYQSYTKTFNQAPSAFSTLGYDSGMVVRAVLAQGVSRRLDFSKGLGQNKGVQGALNTLVLNGKKEFIRPVVTLTVLDGEIVPFGYNPETEVSPPSQTQ